MTEIVGLAQPAQLSIVIPTFNERDNVEPMIGALTRELAALSWEVIYVDDNSPDGTAERVREIARTDARVRCIRRFGRRGLSSAVTEGILSSSAPLVAVMDGDMQHDEKLLVQMLQVLKNQEVDIVIGSRYVVGGGIAGLNRSRALMSRIAVTASRLLSKVELTDPMSGFFMVRRPVFESALPRLSGEGFKILLDLFASAEPRLAFRELPYRFRRRRAGESKLDSMVVFEFVTLLLDKKLGHVIPPRFFLFSIVGTTGLAVHFSALWLVYRGFGLGFAGAQAVGTVVAMTSNFFLNNFLTYHDQRLKGWPMLWGLLSFYVACTIGVVANVGIASYIHNANYVWWVAGGAGALVGVVWNYVVTSLFTWKLK